MTEQEVVKGSYAEGYIKGKFEGYDKGKADGRAEAIEDVLKILENEPWDYRLIRKVVQLKEQSDGR